MELDQQKYQQILEAAGPNMEEYEQNTELVRTKLGTITKSFQIIPEIEQANEHGLSELLVFEQTTLKHLSATVSQIRNQVLSACAKIIELEKAMQKQEALSQKTEHEEKLQEMYRNLHEFEKKKLYQRRIK